MAHKGNKGKSLSKKIQENSMLLKKIQELEAQNKSLLQKLNHKQHKENVIAIGEPDSSSNMKRALRNMKGKIYRDNKRWKKQESQFNQAIGKETKTYISITTKYIVKTFINKNGKRTTQQYDEIAHDYKEIIHTKDFNKAQLKEAEKQAMHDCWQTIEELYESNQKGYMVSQKVTSVSETDYNKHAKNPLEIKMKSSMPSWYKFIQADLNVPSQEGLCVPEYLIKVYKKFIPTLSIKQLNIIRDSTDEEGWTTSQVFAFAHFYKISCYAFDVHEQLFNKCVYNNSNYPCLMFYMIDGHMYPISDKKMVQHLRRKCANTKIKVIRKDIRKEEESEQQIIERFKLPFFEDIAMDQLDKYKDCNIFYHTGNLYNKLLESYRLNRVQYACRFVGNHIMKIEYDNNVHLYANTNHTIPYSDLNTTMKLCTAFKVPFKNQSFTSLAKEVFNKQFHSKSNKTKRVPIPDSLRTEVLERSMMQCNNCNTNVQDCKFEIDHIIPLHCGGDCTNIDNLQVLCKPCHEEKSAQESAERCFEIDLTQSHYNTETHEIFDKKKSAFTRNNLDEEEYKSLDSKLFFGLDINKCRTNIVRHSKFDYCVFSVLDNVVQFDCKKHKDIPIGYYFIDTFNYLPFKGSGWYSYPIVQFGLQEKIINLSHIKYMLQPSLPSVNSDYYESFFNYVVSTTKDIAKSGKFMINSFIGSWGTKVQLERKVIFCKDINEASYHYFNNPEKVIVKSHDMEFKEGGFHEIVHKREKYIDSSYVPIFNQVLDLEAIELYKIQKLLKSHGGKPVYLNTDQVVAQFEHDKQINNVKVSIENHYWDAKKEIPKYSIESSINKWNRNEMPSEMHYELEEKQWRLFQDAEQKDFSKWVQELKNIGSFRLDGLAGTGKSTLLKMFMKSLDADDVPYLVLVPTHKAGRVLSDDAMTLHRFYNTLTVRAMRNLNRYKYIIIDECSMIKEVFYRMILMIKQNTKCHIILSGDFAQLEPVQDRAEFDYENANIVKEICDFNLVKLTECRRADKELFAMYSDPDNLDISQFEKKEVKRSVAFHNSFRKKINLMWMTRMIGPYKKKLLCELKKNDKDKNSQDVFIFKDLPIMACKTRSALNIINGEELVVIDFINDEVVVSSKNHEQSINIPKDQFTSLFYPAYCITCHKCQGSTFDYPYTIYEWNTYSSRMKYVALSRATMKEHINIIA